MKKNKLDNQVNHRIAIVAGLLKRQIYRIIAENGVEITPEQWVILNYLWEKDGLTIGELATKSKKDFANVTRIVEKLQKQGYVTKEKSKDDGRSYLVFYTKKAKEIKSEVKKCQKRSLKISLKDVSQKEQDAILAILDKIEKNSLLYLNETNAN